MNESSWLMYHELLKHADSGHNFVNAHEETLVDVPHIFHLITLWELGVDKRRMWRLHQLMKACAGRDDHDGKDMTINRMLFPEILQCSSCQGWQYQFWDDEKCSCIPDNFTARVPQLWDYCGNEPQSVWIENNCKALTKSLVYRLNNLLHDITNDRQCHMRGQNIERLRPYLYWVDRLRNLADSGELQLRHLGENRSKNYLKYVVSRWSQKMIDIVVEEVKEAEDDHDDDYDNDDYDDDD